ncbi:MAG: 50S ribosomal protein L28 [Rickettsiaceae bacterium H1]|nr:50S ribosomal protein L28 [Rickettsiaceae bacterium H1]
MSKKCDLTGKCAQVGNKVSHSNRKTKRRFFANLQIFSLFSSALNRKLCFKLAVSTLRIIEKKGGIDEFLLNARNSKLTKKGLYFKKQLLKCRDYPKKHRG